MSSPKAGRRPLMAGNWKMNLNHLEAIALTQKLEFSLTPADYEAVDVAILPPFTAIRSVQTLVDGDRLGLAYGAQDLSPHDAGAYTGDVSGAMLAKLGCTYVVVGHSERRQHHAESDERRQREARAAALRHGLVPILCVGEGLDVRREAGPRRRTASASSTAALAGRRGRQGPDRSSWPTSRSGPSAPERWPRRRTPRRCAPRSGPGWPSCTPVTWPTSVRVLYGGSVKAANVAGIMAEPDVDGALVGGASLDAAEFAAICQFHRTSVDVP